MDMETAIAYGLGRGAYAKDCGDLAAILRVENRWDHQTDERAVYLARLIRDHGLPGGLAADALATVEDDELLAALLCDVLALLGERDILAEQVRTGRWWERALETAAEFGFADDLRDTAIARALTAGKQPYLWFGDQWETWARTDPRLWQGPTRRPPGSQPYADLPMDVLIQRALAAPKRNGSLLGELRRREPDSLVLRYADHPEAVRLGFLLHRLAPADLVPAARGWTAGHPLHHWGLTALARHGDERDLPAIESALREVDGWCGYNTFLDGLGRIGGAEAGRIAEPYLERLWETPHSYERASVLRAGLALFPGRQQDRLREGLRDCEEQVRLIAVRHCGPDDYLAGDPLESEQVRVSAARRSRTPRT